MHKFQLQIKQRGREISLKIKGKKNAINEKIGLQSSITLSSPKATPSEKIKVAPKKLQAEKEPVYLAARVEERAPKFAKR